MLAVLYIVGTLGLLGTVVGGVITSIEPEVDPATWIGRGWLLVGGGYGLLRVFMERSTLLRAQPFLLLPVRKAVLVRFMLGTALLNMWNLVPLAFWIPFWIRSVLPAHSMAGALAYGIGVLAGLGIITHLVPWVRQHLGERPLPMLFGGLVLVGVVEIIVWKGAVGAGAAGWLADGLLQNRLLPLMVMIAGYLGALALHRRQLLRLLDLDEGATGSQVDRRSAGEVELIQWMEQQGSIGALLVLELRLIVRNTQPRWSTIIVLLFPLSVAVVAWAARGGALDLNDLYTLFFSMGLFPTGFFVVNHGQNMFSWKGAGLEGLVTRGISSRDVHWAKLMLLWGGSALLFLLSLPALFLWPSAFSWFQAAFFCYNMGVGVPLVLLGAHFNKKTVPLNAKDFTLANPSGLWGLCLLGWFVFPALPFLWSTTVDSYLWSVTAIGLVSVVCLPLWLRLLRYVWQRRRHRVLASFRNADS